jgi:hypothetical protein
VPDRFRGRGRLTTGTATFRIESEGIVAGEPKTRIVAIVQKTTGGAGGAGPSVSVLSWRFEPPRRTVPEKEEAGK